MKKLLCFLLAFGLMSMPVWAADDDEWEDEEEEEEAPKKSSSKKAAPKKSSSGDSRMGFAVNFVGDQPGISFVYDMGNIEIGVGLGISRTQFAAPTAGGDAADPLQTIRAILGVSYGLGKGLLDYGVGVNLGVEKLPNEGGNNINGTPFFYTRADLLPNVSLKLSAGISVDMLALPDPVQNNNTPEMQINFVTSAGIIFYFM